MSKEHDERVERVKRVKERLKANIDAGFLGNQNTAGKLLAEQEKQKREAENKAKKK